MKRPYDVGQEGPGGHEAHEVLDERHGGVAGDVARDLQWLHALVSMCAVALTLGTKSLLANQKRFGHLRTGVHTACVVIAQR